MLFIISVKIYGAIMMKVTFEIKIFSLNKVKKKVLPAARVTYFLAMQVIWNKQPFKVGLISAISNFAMAEIKKN